MNRRQRLHLIKAIIFLFVLNSLSLALYFFLHSPSPPSPQKPPNYSTTTTSLKPWPPLPSFLPWNPIKPPLRSCEAYFGNGFSHRVDVRSDGEGWFRCFYSATLRSSICEGGRVRMDPGKIKMSAGGEGLGSVMGRREEEELPEFESGAFGIEGVGGEARIVDEEFLDRYLPRGAVGYHAMRGLVESMRFVEPGEFQCSQVT